MIAHKLLFDNKKDYSFMCMELLLAVLICVYNDKSCVCDQQVRGFSLDEIFTMPRTGDTPSFVAPFMEKVKEIGFRRTREFSDEPMCYVLPNRASLYGAIVYNWYWMHQKSIQYVVQHTKGDVYESVSKNHEQLKNYAKTIYMMK